MASDAETAFREGLSLSAAGRPFDALGRHLAAWRLDRRTPRYRLGLARAFHGVRLKEASPAVIEALIALLNSDDIDPQEVAPAAQGLLKLSDPEALRQPLAKALLSRAIVTDQAIETALTGLRARAAELPEEALTLLALQADLNRFAWWEAPEETAAVDDLARQLAASPPSQWTREVLQLACYRPLPDWAEGLAVPASPLLRLLHRRSIEEPAAVRRAPIPRLVATADETSRKVKALYEANPYPRWIAVTRQPPRPFAEVLRAILPGIDVPELAAPRVLVAGCGTGAHAVRVASRFAGAEVLAIDLSRASLGYAALKAAELDQRNIAFAEADLLALGDWDRRFDLIECSGVLHHLAEPAQGLAVLTRLLAPGGLMKLGLYARAARRPLAQARALLTGFDATPEGLRAARRRLQALPESDAARAVTRLLDFHSLDGLRDLLFHVQETSYDLGEVQALLDGTGLLFLGFELADPAMLARFRQRHPGRERDLARWQAFEAEAPECFAAMYQFWCRPKGSKESKP
ncbi:MAG TPA: class I SAM-dependent methyltransferase [Kiloniellales bacterium]|nr:class I SAM-dependent methyltransferase [Kiloniellales bacterium]